ncbi:hypothetical protein [Leeuwenhoekiella sp. H156]|uniref:hypothetical protein n=1 Tax=Leeuwenhoekiella sp. H156 TaxID=3450128 RepID=UPI003FA492EA
MTRVLRTQLIFLFLFGYAFAKAQCLQGNCENGFGEYKTESEAYSGFFKDGKFNGSGMLQSTLGVYWGAFKNGIKHGFGVSRNGKEYQAAHWVNGKITDYELYVFENRDFQLAHYNPDGSFKGILVFPSMPLNADGSGCKIGDCKNGWSQRIFPDKGYAIISKMSEYQFSEIMVLQEDNGNVGFLSYRPDDTGHRMAVILNANNWYIGMFNNSSAKDGAGAEYANGQLKQAGIYANGKIQEVMLKK